MKASGIGGATIFNLTSAVKESSAPTKNLPFPDITYRSPKWWGMVEFATSEAQRLGLELGMHNCVGYSATGGPWVTPELSMQRVVFTITPVSGPAPFAGVLRQPYATLGFYRDIAVVAMPDTNPVDPKSVVELTQQMDKDGRLTWTPPAGGQWLVYRFGHSSTGAGPHPAPEDVKALEVDKMSASASRFHWEQVIQPLREHLGAAMGTTFRHLTIDSYEAGYQNWTPGFRETFIKRKGYDPVPWLALLDATTVREGNKRIEVPKRILGTAEQTARFQWDLNDLIAQLYQENNYEQGVRLMNQAGLQLQFEAYAGPFDTIAGSAIADIPMGEFPSGGSGGLTAKGIVGAARAVDRRVVASEALTGAPYKSKFNEDPAFLKMTGDGAYTQGINRLVLHHWVHQPFDDKFKPGMCMGAWGTHFGRHQTWAELGKAYYKYLARTQALLQRGQGLADFLALDHDAGDYADAIPHAALLRGDLRVENGQIVLPSGRRYAFLALPPGDAMLPEVARKLRELVNAGATVVGPKPTRSPSFSGYPACDDEVRKLGEELWGAADPKAENRVGQGKVFAGSPDQALQNAGLTAPVRIQAKGWIRTAARRDGETEIFYLSNGTNERHEVTASFRVQGKLPEIWHPEDGSHAPAPLWREVNGRTEVTLPLKGKESVFVVFRQPAPTGDHAVNIQVGSATASEWKLATSPQGQPRLLAFGELSGDVVYASGKRTPFSLTPPTPMAVTGAWEVAFAPVQGQEAPEKITFPELTSWSEHANPAIKYYSGTAVYRKSIEVPAALLVRGQRLILDLGVVSNLASVKINGVSLGVGWYAPFWFDATAALKPGVNTLQITVVNTWANRLMGDEQEPEDQVWGETATIWGNVAGRPLVAYPDWFVKGQPRPSSGRKTFTTWNYYIKDSPLLPAGLLGPVVLRVVPELLLD
jgi:hypothetical protein